MDYNVSCYFFFFISKRAQKSVLFTVKKIDFELIHY